MKMQITYPGTRNQIKILQLVLDKERSVMGSTVSINQLAAPEGFSDLVKESFFIATLDKKPIGSATIRTYGDPTENCELYKLYVSPEHRRKGFAKSIVMRVASEMKFRGIVQMKVEANQSSLSFWESVLTVLPFDEQNSVMTNILFNIAGCK